MKKIGNCDRITSLEWGDFMFRELIRKNKQLSEKQCIDILKTENRGVLSVIGDNGYPYGMPMNHWYEETDGCIYFHSGNVGHRLEALQKDSRVSFCVYDKGSREKGQWAWKVRSVIVFGKMEILNDMNLIAEITTKLSAKFTDDDDYVRREIEQAGHRTLLLRLTPEHLCGKLVTEA